MPPSENVGELFALNDPLHVGRKRGARSEHRQKPFHTTRIAAARPYQSDLLVPVSFAALSVVPHSVFL